MFVSIKKINIMKTKLKSTSSRTGMGLVLVFSLFLGACKKQDPELGNEDKKESTDATTSSNAYEESIEMVEEVEQTGQLASYISVGACATITIDSMSATRSIQINFGSTNCLCLDGKYRRGSITATWTGTFLAAGSTVGLNFTNYAVNDNQVNGTNSVTYNGVDGNGNWSATVVTAGNIVLAAGAGTVSWNANLTRAQVSGASTTGLSDDQFAITGNASGTSSTGKTYTVTITSPLIRDYSCIEHFTSGTMVVDTGIGPDKTIDFGNGTCDNAVTVTVSGIDYIIYL
jgi:hypothetical protein